VNEEYDRTIDLLDRPWHHMWGHKPCWCLPRLVVERRAVIVVHRVFREDQIEP